MPSVKPADFRIFGKIFDKFKWSLSIFVGKHPANMCPEKSEDGGMNVVFFIRSLMVVAVMSGPPKRSALKSARASKCHNELYRSPHRISTMGKVAVVPAGDKKSSCYIQNKTNNKIGNSDAGPQKSKWG